jgi:hypothetical protein
MNKQTCICSSVVLASIDVIRIGFDRSVERLVCPSREDVAALLFLCWRFRSDFLWWILLGRFFLHMRLDNFVPLPVGITFLIKIS